MRQIFYVGLINLALVMGGAISALAHGSHDHGGKSITLAGTLSQGGLIMGSAPPGTRIQIDDKEIFTTPDGIFVYGFNRTHGPEATLSFTALDGTIHSRTLPIEQRTYQVQHIDGLPPKKVTPPEEVLARIRDDAERVWITRDKRTDTPYFAGEWIWPSDGIITGVYGSQRVLNGTPRNPHYGIDIAAPEGTPVIAPRDGVISFVDPDLYYSGGTVILDHGLGVSSTFLHLSRIDVAVGDKLVRGDQIGQVGSTGRSTGPHLDWRINWFQERLDPAFLVEGKPKPIQ